MRITKTFILVTIALTFLLQLSAQEQPNGTGAWYMYFYNTQFGDSKFGLQGDIQYRNYEAFGDLEQLLLRSGLTYKPKETKITLTLGAAHITSGTFGDSDDTSAEFRIYQELLAPQKIASHIYLTHRFRYEQRFVNNQDFRTRYRYNLFLNIPINNDGFEEKTFYAALYNEIFINGQTDIGNDRQVSLFDRNRTYLGAGYALKRNIRFQLGWMNQKNANFGKGQLQFSMHHTF